MKKFFAQKAFLRWITQEGRRFVHKPHILEVRRDYFLVRFASITPRISCIIKKCGFVEIWAKYRKGSWHLWDILIDFDVVEKHNGYGQYFCSECKPPEMFGSRQDLWVNHSFEPLLEWCNENFRRNKWLYFFGRDGHFTHAAIWHSDKLDDARTEEYFVDSFPVVLGESGSRQ